MGAPFLDAFYHSAQALLAARDAEGLTALFRGRLDADVHFMPQRVDFSFVLKVYEPGKPKIIFGQDLGFGEKHVTMHRLLQILPLVRDVAQHRLDQTVWNMGDEGPPNHVAFCGGPEALLVPDCDFMHSRGYEEERTYFETQPAWSDRDDTPFWRGSSTGKKDGPTILDIPRVRLCQIGQKHGYDFAISRIVQAEGQDGLLHEAGVIGDFRPWQDLSRYRYSIDIDGNTSAWSSLFLKMLAGNVVLKVASPHGFRQWYYDRLIPWVHFVPVRSDMADLASAIDMLRRWPDLARTIAAAGRAFALEMSYEGEMQRAVQVVMDHAA